MIPARVIGVVILGVLSLQQTAALNCYSCSGDECVTSATAAITDSCEAANDNCYTMFSGYLPVRRGCWSKLNVTEQSQCPGADCEVCSTESCNLYSRSDHQCVVCSSLVAGACVSDPASLSPTKCSAASIDVAEYLCYSRVVGSVTERGCVRTQADLDSCDGTQCATCATTGCNNGEFPALRQKCVQCDSIGCNAASTTAYCDLPDDSCITIQRSDGTYLKGCESQISQADVQFCLSNNASCSYCASRECNTGLFDTQLQRKCYTCGGTDCLRTAVVIETCHNYDDQCVTLFEGFNPVQRACRSVLSDEDRARCDNEDDVSCEKCAFEACNLIGREDHQCEYCSSLVDPSCIAAPNTVAQCPAPSTEIDDDAQCYTRIVGGLTERGCLGSAADATECRSSENCQTCAIKDGEACNREVFPADRRKCVVGTQANQYCPKPDDDCVQIYRAGVRSRKCQSGLSDEEASFCNSNSNKCHFCPTDNCNQANVTFNYVECLSCISSTDPNCAIQPSAVNNITTCATCATIMTNSTAGTTIIQRNCLSALAPADQNLCLAQTSCTTCTTNLCNAAVYPLDRLSCYTCRGGACYSHDSITHEHCLNYVQNDRCFSMVDSSGTLTSMGCLSSLSSTEQSNCLNSTGQCRLCSGSDCDDPSKMFGPASCVQCNSESDPDCFGQARNVGNELCNDPTNTKCYSRLTANNFTERGCVSDLDASSAAKCESGSDCSLCSTPSREACNWQEYPVGAIRCHQCNSAENSTCTEHQTGNPSYCLPYNSANHCYVTVSSSGQTVRKCSTRARPEECAGSARCEVCTFTGCNYRASGSVMSMNGTTASPAVTTTSTTTAKPASASRTTVGSLIVAGLMLLVSRNVCV